MKHEKSRHEEIHLGTHGEDYGSWMSNPVFYMIGGLLALSVVLAVLSFTVFRLPWLGAVFSVAAAADPPVPARPPGLRWQGDAAGCGLRLRRPVHPGGPHLAGSASHRYRLLGRGIRLRPAHVREERRQ